MKQTRLAVDFTRYLSGFGSLRRTEMNQTADFGKPEENRGYVSKARN